MSRSHSPLQYGPVFYHAAASPLACVLLNLELAAEHPAAAQVPYITDALKNAQYLHELFTYNPDQSEVFNPFYELKKVLIILQAQYPTVVLKHFSSNKNALIKGNKLQFQEAAQCVIRNAVQAYCSQHPNRVVLISSKNEQNMYQLAFIDGGCGMNFLEKRLALADGFTKKTKGSGIGLPFVKRVITTCFQGKISIYSKKHRGTTVIWKIPLASVNS